MTEHENSLVLLGEIKGQLRELIHIGNNNAQALLALTARVSSLEQHEHRREGASSVFQAVVRSPAVGWLAAGAGALWALLTGRLN